MLTSVGVELLAEAFPGRLLSEAALAAEAVLEHLHEKQWTDRFEVIVGAEAVSIPHRLHFSSSLPAEREAGETYLIGKCLEARSNDGFQRQRAVRQLLMDVQPWCAPFIVALIGEYIIEILRDIHDGLTPQASAVLADFIRANPVYWQLTEQRVVSYWNVYYRAQVRRSEYIGFKLLKTLEEEVLTRRA